MVDLDSALAHVRQRTRAAVATQASTVPDAGALDRAVMAATVGGKAMRPALCVLTARAVVAVEPPEAMWSLAAALELFQAAALIHDDIIDDSPTRRGVPSVHAAFAALHQDSGWSTDPTRFGVSAAILAGDLALSLADNAAQEAAWALGEDRGRRVWEVYRRMAARVVAGQYLDIEAEQLPLDDDPQSALASAWQVIDAKTADYSAAAPMELGAIVAGAPPELSGAIHAIGMQLGRAFQLRDDLIGVLGDPTDAGKPVGADLRQGKRTVLLATAVLRATPAQRAAMITALAQVPVSDAGVHLLLDAITQTGADRAVAAQVADLTETASADLAALGLTGDSDLLIEAARLLTREPPALASRNGT